ncbi:hypothetical protein ABPG72_002552 [Tetrahymena utriculariae]
MSISITSNIFIVDSICDEKYLLKTYDIMNSLQLQTFFIVNQLCSCMFLLLAIILVQILKFLGTLKQISKRNDLQINQICTLAQKLLNGLIDIEQEQPNLFFNPDNILYDKEINAFIYSNFCFYQLLKRTNQKEYSQVIQHFFLFKILYQIFIFLIQKAIKNKYLAPEISCKNQQSNLKANIYSLGVILLEIFFVKRHFTNETEDACLEQQLEKQQSQGTQKLINQIYQI